MLLQMAARLALRKWGKRIGKRLAEVYTAGLFLYGDEDIRIEVHDFLDEPLAVDVAQLRKRCECPLAVHHPNGETIRIGFRHGSERKRKE